MAESKVLVDLNGATVRRDGQRILDDISVQIRLNECWAVIGPMGSGKTPLLLLDNPFVGLDAASRADLATWLNTLIRRDTRLVLVTESDDVPAFVTHVLSLESACWTGPKEHYTSPKNSPGSLSIPALQTPAQPLDATDVFQLNSVTVRYGERLLLNELTWVVRTGEKWALLGPNGVGKSVLLSLLYGDHPQAYANDVRVFGHRRGKLGESIWTVKRRIGSVSPELHLYFPQYLTARQVILTGLTDTLIVPVMISPVTEIDLHALAQYFGVTTLLSRSFGTLSTGEQRLILLIRALIKNPPVLLLDEPFQAFDTTHIQLARQLLDALPEKSLLFVTHNPRELPNGVDQLFELSRIDPK